MSKPYNAPYPWELGLVRKRAQRRGLTPSEAGKLGGRPAKYPWRTLQVGSTFVFARGVSIASARQMAYVNGQKLRRQFSVRLIKKQRRMIIECIRRG